MTWPFDPLEMFGFDFGMADPAWEWEAYGAGGYEKSPEAHYQTMPLEEIMALPVGQLFGAGGLIWLWCTWPLVAKGDHVRVLDAWGFKAKTGGAWAKRTESGKLRWGPGYIVRSVCEPFIIGTIGDKHGFRGRGVTNLIETVEEAVLDGVARQHSRKPEEAYRLIESVTGPNCRRCDLFSRQRRLGWTSWGKEVGKFEGAAA